MACLYSAEAGHGTSIPGVRVLLHSPAAEQQLVQDADTEQRARPQAAPRIHRALTSHPTTPARETTRGPTLKGWTPSDLLVYQIGDVAVCHG